MKELWTTSSLKVTAQLLGCSQIDLVAAKYV
jgi:hypothetical protein